MQRTVLRFSRERYVSFLPSLDIHPTKLPDHPHTSPRRDKIRNPYTNNRNRDSPAPPRSLYLCISHGADRQYRHSGYTRTDTP